MKYLNKILSGAVALTMLVSCTDDSLLEYAVSKPTSIANSECLNKYDVLKNYVDCNASAFKLGTGVSASDFSEQGLVYSLIISNFDEVTAGYAMKHGAVVQDDGTLDLSSVDEFIAAAKEAGVTVYGHTLCWHSNQNADFLNSTIAPIKVEDGSGDPTWDVVSENDFESDDASNYESNGVALLSFTNDGEGNESTGRALIVENESVRSDDWKCQLFFTFPTATEVGDQYTLTIDVKADDPASCATQAQYSAGSYKYWNFFGSVSFTTEWKTFSKTITIDDNTSEAKSIAFNLGNTATKYYFDNIKLTWYNKKGNGGEIELTPEEKKDTLTYELEHWISGIVTDCKDYVKAWDVVNEPMDDGSPYKLKSSNGDDSADEFYWQDYLGKDYAVTAFNLARQYGNTDDKLFINDYNLEYNIDKCKGLIQYVKYIEGQGATVDGIGTQMHITINSDTAKIAQMFTLLAATGKLIKISELDVGLDGVTTENANDSLYEVQKEMYNYVVSEYLDKIPVSQQYGITAWSPFDSPESSSWRAGEPIGLWTEGYVRKPAYAGFANGLAGKNVSESF